MPASTNHHSPASALADRGLRQELALLRGLFEAAVLAIVVVNRAGEIVLVNAAAEALFGYRRDELVGEQMEILLPERLRETHAGMRERFTAEALTRRMGIGLDLIACDKDGIEFPVEIGLSRLQADEGVLISAAISEISERRSRTLLAKTGPGEGKTFAAGAEVPWAESVTRAMETAADRERADDQPPSH